jgi:hypothetical protein
MRTLSLGIMALGLIAAVPPATQQASVEIAVGKSVTSGMPVDTASSFGADVGQIAGWTRVTGVAPGSKITHLWIHGADSSKVELNIGGSPWRTYSRKTIQPEMTGEWTLEVLGPDGAKLATKSFRVG